MATKLLHNDVFDNGLDAGLKQVGDRLTICERAPTSYAEATTNKGSGGVKLAEIAIDTTDFTGPADGDVSGRKLTVGAQTGMTIDVSGAGDHVAIVDVSATKLLVVNRDAADHSGTAQAGAATTITLAAGASAVDDAYNGQTIETTGGTGSGQFKTISDYVGSTKVATVDSAWSTNPDATTTYEVYGQPLTTGAGNTASTAAFDIEIADPT